MPPPPAGKVKPGQPGGDNILEIALAVNGMGYENEDEMVGEFAYLLGAVGCLTEEQQGAVVGLLTGSDKYTLFAPTNEAFRNLQRALTGDSELATAPELSCLVDDILQAPGTLFAVLQYHLTEGRRFSNSVFNKNGSKEIEMLAAGYITTMKNFTIMDGAYQVINLPSLKNVNASNGVIHVIDTVMLPFEPVLD
ncbi:fasciclin domain-containing protein [Pseudomonadota bacterium]